MPLGPLWGQAPTTGPGRPFGSRPLHKGIEKGQTGPGGGRVSRQGRRHTRLLYGSPARRGQTGPRLCRRGPAWPRPVRPQGLPGPGPGG